MSKIISINSYLRGTGKSNITVNLAVVLAEQGKRVAVIDIDLPVHHINLILGIHDTELVHSLDDFLEGRCTVNEAAQDVTMRLGSTIPGRVYLISAGAYANRDVQPLHEMYDVETLNTGIHRLIDELELDVVLIDTQAGLNPDSLLALAISNTVGIILRINRQDYQGTAVTIEVAHRLGVRNVKLIVNQVPGAFEPAHVWAQIEQTYQCPVAAILPHSEQLQALGSADIFVSRYPTHEVTAELKRLSERLLADDGMMDED